MPNWLISDELQLVKLSIDSKAKMIVGRQLGSRYHSFSELSCVL